MSPWISPLGQSGLWTSGPVEIGPELAVLKRPNERLLSNLQYLVDNTCLVGIGFHIPPCQFCSIRRLDMNVCPKED